MCGRYSLICIDDLGNRFRIFNPMLGARSKFNIAPGTQQPVIVPPAPTAEIRRSTLASVSAQISSALVRRWISGLAGSLNRNFQ